MRFIILILGIYSWIDWLPFIDQSSLVLFNQFIILLFLVKLFLEFRGKFNKHVTNSFFLYFFLINISSLINGVFPPYKLLINLIIILLILSKEFSYSNFFFKGFIIGGVFTSIYMLLGNFDIINAIAISNLSHFTLGEYFLENKETVISVGFTNKYNKISYLFSILFFLILYRFKLKLLLKLVFGFLIIYLQILSTGRGGLLISLILLLYYLFTQHKPFFYLACLIFLFYFSISDLQISNLFPRFDFAEESFVSRFQQAEYAINEFDKNLFFGIGYATDNQSLVVHNFFLNNLVCGGITGLILSLYLVASLIKNIYRAEVFVHLKFFILLLLFFQITFENMNLVVALGSFLVFWFLFNDTKFKKNLNN